jgi:hypothetical protein
VVRAEVQEDREGLPVADRGDRLLLLRVVDLEGRPLLRRVDQKARPPVDPVDDLVLDRVDRRPVVRAVPVVGLGSVLPSVDRVDGGRKRSWIGPAKTAK